MDEETAWDVYFAGICAIRFHPKNDNANNNPDHEIKIAAITADKMIQQRRHRWPDGQPQPEQ